MTILQRIKFQLHDQDGAQISATGGKVYVATAGDAAKRAIVDKDNATVTNPMSLTAGGAEFYVASSVSSVDLYIMAPGGQFLTKATVAPGAHELVVDLRQREQVAVIPFAIGDTTDAVETDTGFDLPSQCFVLDRLHGCGVRVTTLDATEDIDVGILSTESGGDANGFIAASDLDNAVLVIGTNGALFSTNAPHASDSITGKSISYTLTSGTDTAEGFILLPYVLAA